MIVYWKKLPTRTNAVAYYMEDFCCENMERVSNSIEFMYLYKCPFCKENITKVPMKNFDCFIKKLGE